MKHEPETGAFSQQRGFKVARAARREIRHLRPDIVVFVVIRVHGDQSALCSMIILSKGCFHVQLQLAEI